MSRYFLLLVFSWISFPSSPRVSHEDRFNFFWKFAEYSQVKVHLRFNDTGGNLPRCQRHRWQIMATISGCWDLKVNLKAKMNLSVNSTSQRCPNKIIKTFMIFPFATNVNDTGGAPWAANISLIFEKIWNGPNGILRGLGGNWFLKKTRSRKSSDTTPLEL